ncbi:MAG: hypothetical protein J7M21_05830 [Planctomycetes bacterium]|nr:hypothetical protein [Planctomycetota bacterium]
MTQLPQGPTIPVKPQPNIYTVMLLVAIIALAMAVVVVFWKLTSPPPVGYGMEFGDFFKPIKPPAP